MSRDREVRTLALDTAELRVERCAGRQHSKHVIRGYAAVFNSWSQDLGGFKEIIRPGAFTRTLEAGGDVMALFNHDRSALLGRRSAGTLRLAEDDRGLLVEIEPPDTTLGRDVVALIRRGDLRGMSFAFTVHSSGEKRGESWGSDGTTMTRELRDVDLFDVTVATDPVYLDTAVALRSLEAARSARTPDAASTHPDPHFLTLAEAELNLARLY